jgi:polyhydroxybutyrate depolymerase
MQKVDDVTYARESVRIIEASVSLDSSRRYAMGWSNGGFMVERLACETPELWAGIAADASSVVIGKDAETGHSQCDASFLPHGHLDMIHFSGTSDTAVTWTGSAWSNPAGTPSALDDIARWVRRMGCSARLHQTYNDGTFSNLVWPDCRNGTQLEFMTARNGQHSWWTTQLNPQFVFETTTYVFNFFDKAYKKRHGML